MNQGKNILENQAYRERLVVIILGMICFLLHLHIPGFSILNGPYVYGDEMGYWANAATLAGYDWSPTVMASHMAWYSYGYSLTLLPLFWIFDNMAAMYKMAIVLNAVWATLSFFICYSIAQKLGGGRNRYWLLSSSFIVSIYSSSFFHSSIAWSETFLIFMVWLTAWLFIRYEENPSLRTGVCLSCAVSYAYLIHHRTIGILIAFWMTILLMKITKRIRWKDLVYLIIPALIIMSIDFAMTGYLSGQIWGPTHLNDDNDYSGQFEKLKHIFTDFDYTTKLMKSIIGKLWYAGTSTFMILFWGLVHAVRTIWNRFKEETGIRYSLLFFLLAYAGMTAVSSIFTVSLYRVDFLYYGRYSECAAGVLLLLGFGELSDLSAMPGKSKALMAVGTFAAYIISFFIVEPCAAEILSVNSYSGHTLPMSTGIVFGQVLGNISVRNSFTIAIAMSVIIFIIFSIDAKILVYKTVTCMVIAGWFLYAGTYAVQNYTVRSQRWNNDVEFLKIVDTVESNLQNAKIFIGSDDLQVYFDFQTRMIHNTVYPEEPKTVIGDDTYDVVILRANDVSKTFNTCYRPWVIDSNYAVLFNSALESELNFSVDGLPVIDWLTYDFGDFEFFEMDGFSGKEQGHRWTDASPAEITVDTLEKGQDYDCKVILGVGIPMKSLGLDSFSGSIIVNHHEEAKIDFTILPGDTEVNFMINGELLDAGISNQIEIYTPLWSPSEYVSEDTRTLGISIDKIIFTPRG